MESFSYRERSYTDQDGNLVQDEFSYLDQETDTVEGTVSENNNRRAPPRRSPRPRRAPTAADGDRYATLPRAAGRQAARAISTAAQRNEI